MAGSIVVSKARRDALVVLINQSDRSSWDKQVLVNDAQTCNDEDFIAIAKTFCDSVNMAVPKEVSGE